MKRLLTFVVFALVATAATAHGAGDESRVPALTRRHLRAAEHCTVHRSLHSGVEVEVRVGATPRVPVAPRDGADVR